MSDGITIKKAQRMIRDILASIPDSELPQFDRVEINDRGETLVWWGGNGHILGTAKRGNQRRPKNYRDQGAWGAIQGEMTYRADLKHLREQEEA